MNVVYLGTPEFSVLPLKSIIDLGKDKIIAVCTNKDKPVGRKKIPTPSPVKVFALNNGIKVFEYDKIRVEGVEDLKALKPDIMITCAFGQILSAEILDIPKYGVINIHASLLPKYRGASPIQAAIKNGETETGITIMRTNVGIDDGDIIYSKTVDILPEETAGELFERLSFVGAECVLHALDLIRDNKAEYTPQDEKMATFTKMIKKSDAKIDWNLPAEEVKNAIRAFNPDPIAWTEINGQILNVFNAKVAYGNGAPGEVLSAKKTLEIACRSGSIIIEKVQKSGGKVLSGKEFLCGFKIEVGKIIE